jgi:hypothetical protein
MYNVQECRRVVSRKQPRRAGFWALRLTAQNHAKMLDPSLLGEERSGAINESRCLLDSNNPKDLTELTNT